MLRCLVSEFLGTMFLLATVVGSGALMHNLDAGNVAVTVFGVAVATGCLLYSLIEMLGGISAHFNPVVTLVNAVQGNLRWRSVPAYALVQILGATCGVMLANLMFEQPAIAISQSARGGYGQLIAEVTATFGLIGVISGCSRFKPAAVPQAVSAYVAGAIMFTSSTCFANPAVSISRIFTGTITGIRPIDVLPFIGCELLGGALALAVFGWLLRPQSVPKDFFAQTNSSRQKQHLPEERSLATVSKG